MRDTPALDRHVQNRLESFKASTMNKTTTLEIPIRGMDCAECTRHVQEAIAGLPGVESVDVLLGAEKAIVRLDPVRVDLPAIRAAVIGAGDYAVPDTELAPPAPLAGKIQRQLGWMLAAVFGVVLAIVVLGEWLGAFDFLEKPLSIDRPRLIIMMPSF